MDLNCTSITSSFSNTIQSVFPPDSSLWECVLDPPLEFAVFENCGSWANVGSKAYNSPLNIATHNFVVRIVCVDDPPSSGDSTFGFFHDTSFQCQFLCKVSRADHYSCILFNSPTLKDSSAPEPTPNSALSGNPQVLV